MKMINATMCFLRNCGMTLFLYRNKGKNDIHNEWYVPPGGRIERGERSIDCIFREFQEETGLKLIEPRLRVLATFYNKDRILGGKQDPKDWKVEVYEANRFTGDLKEEHPKAKLIWIYDSEIESFEKVYPGDKKIFNLLDGNGVFEAIIQYSGKKLTRFDYKKVY